MERLTAALPSISADKFGSSLDSIVEDIIADSQPRISKLALKQLKLDLA